MFQMFRTTTLSAGYFEDYIAHLGKLETFLCRSFLFIAQSYCFDCIIWHHAPQLRFCKAMMNSLCRSVFGTLLTVSVTPCIVDLFQIFELSLTVCGQRLILHTGKVGHGWSKRLTGAIPQRVVFWRSETSFQGFPDPSWESHSSLQRSTPNPSPLKR